MFFFSIRRRHTRWPRDWSSDVCSSDLFVLLPDLDSGLGHGRRRNQAVSEWIAGRSARRIAVAADRAIGHVREDRKASCRERVWIWVADGWWKQNRRERAESRTNNAGRV